jgi:hypothetical protein
MNHIRTLLLLCAVTLVELLNTSTAGTLTPDYSGQLTDDIVDGASTIPSGSPFSGQLTYDVPQTGATPFFQGTVRLHVQLADRDYRRTNRG